MKGVREKTEEKTDAVYSSEESVDKLLHEIGVAKDQVTTEERQKLSAFADYAGKRLLNANLVQAGKKYKKPSDAVKAVVFHADRLGYIAQHDLVHAMVAYKLNSGPDAEKTNMNSLVPEIFKPNPSQLQTALEEFPASLWTAGGGGKSTLVAFIDGQAGKYVHEFFARQPRITNYEAIETLAKRLDATINTQDFESLMNGFADFAFASMEIQTESGKKMTSKAAQEAKGALESFKQLFFGELKKFMNGMPEANNKAQQTLQLFLDKAKMISDHYKQNPRILIEEFLNMGDELFKKLR